MINNFASSPRTPEQATARTSEEIREERQPRKATKEIGKGYRQAEYSHTQDRFLFSVTEFKPTLADK